MAETFLTIGAVVAAVVLAIAWLLAAAYVLAVAMGGDA